MSSLSMDSRQRIERFVRVFKPSDLSNLDALVDKYAGLSGIALTEKLEEAYIGKRFIRLKDQQNVHFPSQRSKSGCRAEKVKGTITRSPFQLVLWDEG